MMNLKFSKGIFVSSICAALLVGAMSSVEASDDKSSMQAVKKEVSEAADAIERYSADQRDQALDKARTVMVSLDGKIDRLRSSIKHKWDHMDQSARRKADETLHELQKQRQHVADSYTALKDSSTGAWGQMKKGFADSYDDLEHAWQKASNEFDGKK